MILRLLSLLLPSWAFFNRAGFSLVLEGYDKEQSKWISVREAPTRVALPLFGNFAWNDFLFFYSRLEFLYDFAKRQDLRATQEEWARFLSDFQLRPDIQYRLLSSGEELVVFGELDGH